MAEHNCRQCMYFQRLARKCNADNNCLLEEEILRNKQMGADKDNEINNEITKKEKMPNE